MTKLRSITGSFTLILIMSLAAFAGDMSTPPCTPGDMSTPPCAASQPMIEDTVDPERTDSQATAEMVVISIIAEAAVGAFLSVV